ncbi:MAG: substrate-binding domain-containing protein [Rubripirellula sp.]
MVGKPVTNRHVGILVETDDTWGRDVVEAVCRIGQDAGWSVLIAPRDEQGRLRLPRVWAGHGVIASLRHRSMVRHLKNLKLPTVDVSLMVKDEDWFARVATDDQARAKMALDHLRSRGLKHFACYAPPIGRYSDVRSRAFQDAVESAGFTCATYSSGDEDAVGWLTNYTKARQWLADLPKPLGVFAADPYPARQLVEICAAASIRVPDDVAVLSGDDDDLLCNVAMPKISSIELASHRIGETAAQLLQQMMSGTKTPQKTTLIAPLRIRARHSTDILAIDDAEVAGVLKFIRERAKDGISVADILRAFPISRRSLEQRFREKINRSPAEEIRRARFEHVCRLLLDTDKSIATIAHESGFASGAGLSQAFQQHFKIRPGQFRESRH